MSNAKIKRQYIHQGWEITIREDGTLERRAVTAPSLLNVQRRHTYRFTPTGVKKLKDHELLRIGLNLLADASEKLHDDPDSPATHHQNSKPSPD